MMNSRIFFLVCFCLQFTIVCSQETDWTTLSQSAYEKLEAQSAKVNGRLYVFAGFLEGLKITGITEEYNPITDSWTIKAPMPVPVTHMGIVVNGEDVWIIGGFTGDHPGERTDIVQVYNTSTNTWRNESSIPIPTGSLAAAINDGKIHIFGGLEADRKTDIDNHYILDLNNKTAGWVEAANMPEARNHLGGAAVLGLVYAVGGQNGHDGGAEDKNFMHAYDPSTDSWMKKADLPTVRSHFEPGIFVYNNKIFIVGGRSNKNFNSEISEYDPSNNTWTNIGFLPYEILAPVAKEFDGELIVSNGRIEGVCCPTNSTISMTLPEAPMVLAKDPFVPVDKAVQIYPNPISGETFTLDLTNSNSMVSVSITDTMGRLIYVKETKEDYLKINSNIFPFKGLYILTLKGSKMDQNWKLLVK